MSKTRRNATTEHPTELPFENPRAGTWMLDETHFRGPFSGWTIEVYPPAMKGEFGESMTEYGAPLGEPGIERARRSGMSLRPDASEEVENS